MDVPPPQGRPLPKETEGQPTANGGREVKAADWKYSFERLVYDNSPAYFLDMVKGYQDFCSRDETGATEWAGIKVIDDYTLQFELEYPSPPSWRCWPTTPSWLSPRKTQRNGARSLTSIPWARTLLLREMGARPKFVTKRNPTTGARTMRGGSFPTSMAWRSWSFPTHRL